MASLYGRRKSLEEAKAILAAASGEALKADRRVNRATMANSAVKKDYKADADEHAAASTFAAVRTPPARTISGTESWYPRYTACCMPKNDWPGTRMPRPDGPSAL